MRFALISTAVVGVIAASIAMADEPAPSTQPAQGQQLIETYDISDVLRNQADYPLSTSSLPQFAGGPGGGVGDGSAPQRPSQPQGLFAGNAQPNPGEAAPAANAVTPESLMTLIKQMVLDQNSNVAVVGNMVILQARDSVQQKMQSLLNSMHEQQAAGSMMVCSRVFWLSLSPAEVASIFEKVKSGTNVAPMPEVPESLVDASHLYCQAQTICFSGQTIHVVSGRSQSYISGVTPVVGSNSVGYSPTVSEALSGVTVELKPQLLSAGSAVVDIASMVNESGDKMRKIDMAKTFQSFAPDAATQPSVASQEAPVIETPNVVQQEFHTTVRLPVGKKILVGGMTLEPAAKDQAGRQLFLAMEVDAVK